MKQIKNIGRCRWNGIGADLCQLENGRACIKFDKLTHDLPRGKWKRFDNLEQAESWIESREGSNGLNTLINIINDCL